MTPDDWTAQMRLRGLPDSHHRMMLESRPVARFRVGRSLICVAIFSALVWAAIIFH